MKTVIEMAREANIKQAIETPHLLMVNELERFAELVRADERDSWPAEMEAMERQVNILTDALNDRQRGFDAMTVQHKRDVHYWQDQTLNARADERETCAKVCEQHGYEHFCGNVTDKLAETIRARGSV